MRTLKTFLWFLNGVITIGIMASVALYILKAPPPPADELEAQLDRLVRAAKQGSTGTAEDTRLLKYYEAIWQANVIDRRIEEAPDNPDQTPGGPGPGIATFVEPVAIVGDHVALKYKKPAKDPETDTDIRVNETRAVRKDDRIPGIQPVAVVKEIHAASDPEKVGIEFQEKLEYLEIDHTSYSLDKLALPAEDAPAGPAKGFRGPAGQMARTGRVPSVRNVPANATEGVETRPGFWTIPAAEAGRVTNEARDILEQAEISSNTDGAGRPAGIRLDHVQPGSLILERGFEVGDVVKRINGQPINSKSDLIDWVDRNQKSRTFRVELLRRGRTKFLSYTIQKPR